MPLSDPRPRGGRPLAILLANRIVPRADRDSGSVRLLRLIELLLADGHRVVMAAERDEPGQHEAALVLEAMGVEVHRPPVDRAALARAVRPDVAWLSFHDVGAAWLPVLRADAPGARVVVDTVDVHWVREARAAEVAGSDHARAAAQRTREAERAVYSAADAVVAVSAQDAAAAAELAPHVPVSVVSNVHPPEAEGPGFAQRSGALFVGNFRHSPNVDAALFLAREIWPRVRAALPGATLTLAGDAPPPEVVALAGEDVVVTGWVPEVAPHLDAARVSVAPLRFGAGVKGKIGEALAHGLPVVTTAVGGEGMGLVDGEHALIGETAEELAGAIVALHTDAGLWGRMAAAGRAQIAAALGTEVARDALRATLTAAAPPLYLAERDLGDAALTALLEDYTTRFPVDAAVSLAFPTDAPEALLGRLVGVLATLGRDPEAIPDVAITPWPAGAPAPRGARAAGTWDAEEAPAPAAARAPRAAVAVRLPRDPGDARVQLDALLAAGVPDDVELLLLAEAELPVPAPAGARVVALPREAGRRLAQLRALHATAASTLVVVEPHALPEPGFAEPLIAAVEVGAAFAGPQIDGVHGLRVAPADGALWPLLDAEAGRAAQALPFDVLAASRATWLALPHVLPMSEGMAEAQLGAWAAPRGGVAVASDARFHRQPVPPQSVIICTRNRPDELPDAIALLTTYGAAEIIISDSASTDETPQVAAALADQHPGVVKVVLNEEPGAARARNAAAAVASHELLLAMDDDSRPAPGWLEGLTRELARPGVANVGGPVAALWPASRPAGWPGHRLERFHSACERTDGDETLPEPAVPYGNNWGVRRSALLAIGGFDTRFGPAPGSAVNGEESLVTHMIRRGGHGAIRYVAAAGAGHRISADRVDDGFVRHRALCVGVERARINAVLEGLDEQRFLRDAQASAGKLLALVPLHGDLRLEDAMDAIAASGLPLHRAVAAADALGELAGALLLIGRTDAGIGTGLVLRFDAAHLRGVLRAPVAA
jgi:glycosyltransferase involved in cell wall biosynthesis